MTLAVLSREDVPVSRPGTDVLDMFLRASGREAPLLGAKDGRALRGRVGGAIVLEVVDEAEGGRVVLAEGGGGGPIDGRDTPIEGRVAFSVVDATRPAGVPVRELRALGGAVASCFVGDFEGDCRPLSAILFPRPCVTS